MSQLFSYFENKDTATQVKNLLIHDRLHVGYMCWKLQINFNYLLILGCCSMTFYEVLTLS